ncbi:aldehyde dehydrogenase family protein, partial [Bdellovibrionota bacterium FG-2]
MAEPLTAETVLPYFERAKTAQMHWQALGAKKRAVFLSLLRETLLNHADDLVVFLSDQTEKPPFEVLSTDLLPATEMLDYYSKQAPKLLRDRHIHSGLLKFKKNTLNHWPLGVVMVLSSSRNSFFLPLTQIMLALVAGNAVLFKPSKKTAAVGLRIQEVFEEAGFPPYLLQTIVGGADTGALLVAQKPAKIFFSGHAEAAKRVLADAAKTLVPVSLEISGKEVLLVLPDANLDLATSAVLWGACSRATRLNGPIELILAHERIIRPFTALLEEKTKKTHSDLTRSFKLLTGSDADKFDFLSERSAEPTLSIQPFRSVSDAVHKANQNQHGIVVSVMTRNHRLGEQIARQLEVGAIIINDVAFSGGSRETTWGGVKETGLAKTRCGTGLSDYVNIRHIHKPRSSLFVFKALWWFPYSPFQFAVFRTFLDLFRQHWTDRARTFPHFLWNLVQL